MPKKTFKTLLFVCLLCLYFTGAAQVNWTNDGDSYFKLENNELRTYTLPDHEAKTVISKTQLTPEGHSEPLEVAHFSFSSDQQKILLFTNTQRVWRLNTKGDYWVFDFKTNTLKQLGKNLPSASLMFAKFSPDGNKIAYVSGNNLYSENYESGAIQALTTNGTVSLINGTFDWAYEEEFFCRDGFRWSPDSKSIAYWQIDAGDIKKFYMINNTEEIYSQLVPLEYPKVGETPSVCRVGVVALSDAKTKWMEVPGDPAQNYLVRMEYIPGTNELLLQQLNRKQNQSTLYIADASNGNTKSIHQESDEAWVDMFQVGNPYAIDYTNGFSFLDKNKNILWASEKDGWRHLYQVSLEGKPEMLITKGEFDVIDLKHINTKEGFVYYLASPDNATQKYLYRSRLNGKGKNELVSPESLKGTHDYSFSSNGTYAEHTFSNHHTPRAKEFIKVVNHKALTEKESILAKLGELEEKPTAEFFTITTADNIEMDGWMVKPTDFDPSKKYPIVFYVYTEPAGTTVNDAYNVGRNWFYKGNMADDGYIYISLDNRGTPAPKGREWRKSIYRKIGVVNIRDQAMAAREILKWDFVDSERVAVWGHSGGGSATLNLMFKHPDIYKTGISLAAVANQLTYDNIYQERYMGLPQENREDFIAGSPVTHAGKLEGNLLYIHGTGDDNVHYQNAELLINELIKHNKQFQFMPYPNRSHGFSEGEGTWEHLSTMYTNYLKLHCPPGGR
ncbi:S9 family peptidase [Robiginitalea aurantiaca]|uniref:DPP IV N-terminal domain-containing protein n=1 Tax=Robiginitalea aurantiaca TaxID=3056915 RepID=A0ABT7WEV9_9FLAO|nr:DPP IV N-terminal domain-containing protein [Robiginitalea aurantiaca]MDM9631455.1 DPP IV N-terminal domain-containing protein [Robiginitalea aurantiaca]